MARVPNANANLRMLIVVLLFLALIAGSLSFVVIRGLNAGMASAVRDTISATTGGSHKWLFVAAGLLFATALVLSLFAVNKRQAEKHHSTNSHLKAESNNNASPELVSYVLQGRSRGIPEEKIKESLRSVGWGDGDIAAAFLHESRTSSGTEPKNRLM